MSPAVSDYVSKRLEAIEKFFINDTTAQVDVDLAKTTNHHRKGDVFRAEIHITAKDKNLFASAEEEDLYRAIDMVRDEMLQEIRSNKSKKISLVRRGGARVKNILKGLWPR